MQIEIGKTYNVTNMFKKTFVEVNVMTASEKPDIVRSIVWRTGDIQVTPTDEYEVETIQDAVDAGEEFDDIFEFYFTEHEFDSSWDGYSEDYECADAQYLEDLQYNFQVAEEEGYDWDFISWLEENEGYGFDETEFSIEGPIEVTEVS